MKLLSTADGFRSVICICFVLVAPLTMVAYLSIEITQKNVLTDSATQGLETAHAIWFIFGTVRAFRWVSNKHMSTPVLWLCSHTALTLVIDRGNGGLWGLDITPAHISFLWM